MKKIALLALLTITCNAHAQGIEGAKERIRQVIEHVKENPREAAGIGKHPKKNKVFSRTFNESVSSRAYFQLHTDPSLDTSSGEMLEKVARYYLDHPEEIDDPDGPYWAGEYHSACLVKFGLNGTERRGAIPRKSERIVLEYMLAFVNHWSRLDHYAFSLKHQTYAYESTENHWWQEVVTCWGYLLALKDDPDFNDRKLKDGKSLQEHFEHTSEYMKQHMSQRARKGFLLEISAPGYFRRMHAMWYTIYDLSPDKKLRDLAQNTLDLYWAFWAEEQISGERGGGKVRSRGYEMLDGSERVKLPAWIFFGTGQQGMTYLKEDRGALGQLSVQYTALFSGYLPDESIYRFLADRKNAPPYSITQRRLGRQVTSNVDASGPLKELATIYDYKEANCLKYSWVTTNFVIGTVMRPPEPWDYWQKGTAQGWAHGLIIAREDPRMMPERVIPVMLRPEGDIASDQYAVQSKGSLMARKLPAKRGSSYNNELYPFGVFISQGLSTQTELRSNFLFVNNPRCWVAVRAVGTRFVLNNGLLREEHQKCGNFYKLEDDSQPLIIEAALPCNYGSFDEFRSKVLTAQLKSKDGAHAYQTLSGDVLTMHDDRSYPRINGRRIEYNPEMAYDSRYIKSKWDSGRVTISAGGVEKILDFTLEVPSDKQ